MQVSDEQRSDLPAAVLARVVSLAEEAWAAVMGEELSAAEAEERVVELTRELGQELLSAGWSERHGRHTGPRRSCGCGGSQRFEGYRCRRLMTVLGEVRYERAYYRCGECGGRHYAGDEALGISETGFTVPAQEMVSLVCSELPFESAWRLLQRMTAVSVSLSHVQRLSESHGRRLEEQWSEEREALFAGQLWRLPEGTPDRLYVALDGTQTRLVDDWHETKVGAVYEVEPDEEGRDQAVRTTYVSGVQERPECFGRRLYQEAQRRGVESAQEVVVVADGAPWIWNLAAEHFPQRVEILDFYHAAQRLHEVGDAVYGEGSAAGRRWAEANKGRLLEGEVQGVFRSLRGLRPEGGEGREAVRLALHYLQTNRQRID
jgi:hypothetical protein